MGKHSAAEEYVPPRKRGVFTENDRFVAMVVRMVDSLERRLMDDPSVLVDVDLLAERFAELVPAVIAYHAARYAQNPRLSPSAGEIAALMGTKKQSISERRKKGDRVLMERMLGEPTVRRRDRVARTVARKHADATLASWLERKEPRCRHGATLGACEELLCEFSATYAAR